MSLPDEERAAEKDDDEIGPQPGRRTHQRGAIAGAIHSSDGNRGVGGCVRVVPVPGGGTPMNHTIRASFVAKYLDPSEILGEILFGLIMVLSFTLGAGLVIAEGDGAIKEMLLAIVACNIAWGIIDAGMYLMTCVFERSRNRRLWRAVKAATGDAQALAIVHSWLEAQLSAVTSESTLGALSKDVLGHLRQREPDPAPLRREDWFGAVASFWLVVLSTIPAVLPFLIFDSRFVALRVSNGLLLGMLFLVGYQWSRHTSGRPWLVGLAMLACGGALVAVAMAFGA